MTDRSTWTRVKFGDVVKLNTDRSADPLADGLERYVGLEHIEPEDLRIRRWGLVAEGTTFTNRFRPGQTLFGKRRAYQRKVAVADFEGICSSDIYVFEPKDDRLLPELLPFLCQTEGFFEHAVGTSAGSLSPRTNWTQLANYEFALPPLEEQRRIVDLLQSAEKVKHYAHEAQQSGWATRIATYIELTQRGINDVSSKETDAGLISSHWRVLPVSEAVHIENQLRKPISAAERSTIQGKYPYFGPTGQLDFLNEYRLEGTYALIGEDGDHFLKQSIWSMTQLVNGRFNVNNHAHVIRGSAHCSTEWFFHYFRHREVRRWLTKQGAGRLKLKKSDLEQIPIALPPTEEQSHLVAILENMARANEILDHRLEEASNILRNLLNCTLGDFENV
jgi:type I restriction enzyme, S subunit